MYKEDKLAALPYRRRILAETNAYIERMRGECDERRRNFFVRDMSTPLDYMLSSALLREEFVKMLGRPLDGYAAQSDRQFDGNDTRLSERYELKKVGDDEFGEIYRLWVEVDAGCIRMGCCSCRTSWRGGSIRLSPRCTAGSARVKSCRRSTTAEITTIW